MRWQWLSLACAVLIWACSRDVTGPGLEARPGALQLSGWSGIVPIESETSRVQLRWDRQPALDDVVPPRVLVMPDTVSAHIAFEVVTHTVGPNGCWQAAGQKVSTSGLTLTLAPLDRHSGAALCTTLLHFPAHRSSVVLSERGEWTVRVVGQRITADGSSLGPTVAAERTVVVR